ncbi:MAG: metallopeptidase family protein [Clostridia bacterium]|nr:metallopeptidase family protein [Clostridia bacterium]
MKTYDEVGAMLEQIIDNTPAELLEGLSGGVILSEEQKLHPKSVPYRPLYVMGEYHDEFTGRFIVIYYGSFNIVYGNLNNAEFYEQLRHTFAHELRHHLEKLSGIRDLNKYDDEKLDMYTSGMDIAEFHEPPI